MSLIVVENGSLSFGGRTVFEGLNLRVGEQERIGLVGPNGSGKSTLLKAMCGRQLLDGGQVRLARHCSVGYLPQDILEVGGSNLLGSVMEAVPGRTQVEQELAEAESALAQSSDPEEQLRYAGRLATLHERLERFETYYSEARAITILVGLGFRQGDLGRPTGEFSGGWKMRAALAGLLFQGPDVLFLDEPTNHLDVPSVVWLDEYLAGCTSSLVLICHDRSFLNRHIERVVSFEPEGVRTYAGNFDDYKLLRVQEEEVLEANARNREREVKELQRFVDRFKAKANKARQAQSRAKLIEKKQKEIEKPIYRPQRMHFSFPACTRSGRDVLTLDGVSKRFGALTLYDRLARGIYAGDRVAIVGVNGVGKTTLLKIMAGELKPDSGTVRYGANVELGYYAQHHTELLDPRRSVLEEVWRLNPQVGQSFARGLCGAFLFSGDDVDKAVGVLSGGERARVLLARLLIKPANLLLMDEPTNHLDTDSAEALAEALTSFAGTLVFVSHNSSFVNHLATKVWDIQDGQVVEYPGNLDDYFHHLTLEREAAQASTLVPHQGSTPAQAQASPDGRGGGQGSEPEAKIKLNRDELKQKKRREAERRNELARRTRKVREEIAQLEQRIAVLEAEQQELEPQMADPEFYRHEAFKEALRRYEDNRTKIEELYGRWTHLTEKLEQMAASFATQEEAEAS